MSKLQGVSVRVPLVYDNTDGPYKLNKTTRDAIKQNMKMIILTSPGERIFEPDFGVGLRNFLFENISDQLLDRVVEKIKSQVDTYLPSAQLTEIDFITSDEDPTLPINRINISIKYNILPFNSSDELTISSTTTN